MEPISKMDFFLQEEFCPAAAIVVQDHMGDRGFGVAPAPNCGTADIDEPGFFINGNAGDLGGPLLILVLAGLAWSEACFLRTVGGGISEGVSSRVEVAKRPLPRFRERGSALFFLFLAKIDRH
jgi:hypothetical protein